MNMKTLYHGSISYFDKVLVSEGKGYKDFGKGFYMSGEKQHAERLARRNKRIELDRLNMLGKKNIKVNAYLYEFKFDMDLLDKHNPKKFPADVDLEWVEFVLANRRCATRTHSYGSVIGATADDNTKTSFKAYFAGAYGLVGSEKAKIGLLVALETDNLPRQYYFGSQVLADSLKRVRRDVIA